MHARLHVGLQGRSGGRGFWRAAESGKRTSFATDRSSGSLGVAPELRAFFGEVDPAHRQKCGKAEKRADSRSGLVCSTGPAGSLELAEAAEDPPST